MVELVFQRAQYKLSGLNDSDIEHYHRIRNQLYHNGTGLGVDRRYLVAYRQIAAILLDNLFDIKAVSKEAEATLENLILLFNEVETLVRDVLNYSNIDIAHTFKWEMAMKVGILDIKDINELTELRMIRNTQVHSKAQNIDREKIKLGVQIAEALVKKLRA
tara:strand:- start:228 stop:710 length:483 start_codon:yes stop_codon:yes gene_type:complete